MNEDERKSMPVPQIINFSNAAEKANHIAFVRVLIGVHRVEIVRHRPRRSDRQNRWYHPCFVAVFGDYLRGQGFSVGDDAHEITDDEVHMMFRMKFLTQSVFGARDGLHLGDFPRSTTELSTVEFNEYLDKIAAWLATFGIVVPEPGVCHEAEEMEQIEW